MDQEIRNKLRNVVTQCRKLLAGDEQNLEKDKGEIRELLEGRYGIFATKDQVTADPNAKMTHLTEEEQAARKDILDHFAHISARGFKPKDAPAQLVREVAFTHLNRLVAYKLMETRGLIREAVSRGVKSQGFIFYLADHPEDELRCSKAASKMWLIVIFCYGWARPLPTKSPRSLRRTIRPTGCFRRSACSTTCSICSTATTCGNIWGEDETIGWVYQYFTPKELRDQARKESAAPRNSYELAFRNQFYTPRYVVEFLTDNTLGRIWYEMRRGETALRAKCRYLVDPDRDESGTTEDNETAG